MKTVAKSCFAFVILINFLPVYCVAQKSKLVLAAKFKAADSVILVRHTLTRGITIRRDEDNTPINQKLIINGKPNYAIVKEKKVLIGTQIESLVKILTRPNFSGHIEFGRCFIPHHTIFLIKNGKTSFIDLCFACRNFDTSSDIKLDPFEPEQWDILISYFENLGFKVDVDITE